MHSKPTIVLLIISALFLVHAVSAFPAELAIPDGALATQETPQDNASVPESTNSGSAEAENQSTCEPCTFEFTSTEYSEMMEKLAADNLASNNTLYPFSAMAEVIHSHRRKRESGTGEALHLDVCNRIKDIALQTVPDDTETPCPWTYDCTYYPNMLPHYILQANCTNSTCSYPLSCSQENPSLPPTPPSKRCLPYNTTYSVLDFPLNDEPSRPFPVQIGCACEE